MPLARFDTWVRSAVGPAAAGTQVYICTQPAVTSTIPPSPLASLFSDSGSVTPVVQPLVADGFGHAYAYVASGIYTVVLVQYGLVQQVFPDQLIGGGAGSSLVLQTNGVPNTVQSLQNLKGAGSVSVSSDGVGGVTITGAAIGGSDTQVQYNAAGIVAGDPDFEWDYTNKVLKLGDTTHPGAIKFTGITSGIVTVKAPTAPATWSLTLPTSAGTTGQSLITDGSGNTSWATPSTGPRPSLVNWHVWNAGSGTQAYNTPQVGTAVGIAPFSNGATLGQNLSTTTTPAFIKISNAGGASAGSCGMIYDFPKDATSSLTGNVILSTLLYWEAKVFFNTSYNQGRTWVGFKDGTGTTANTNSPSSYNIVGFRYDPAEAGDQFWQVFLGGAVTPIVIPTSVPIQTDGLGHVFSIKQVTGTLFFYIDGVQVASSTYSGLTNLFFSFFWVDNDDATTVQWTANTKFGLGALIYDAPHANYWIAENSGTTGAGSDPFPSSPSVGDTLNDNGIIWIHPASYTPTLIGCAWYYWESSI